MTWRVNCARMKDELRQLAILFPESSFSLTSGLGATIFGVRHRCRLRSETGWAEFGYILCYFKKVSPSLSFSEDSGNQIGQMEERPLCYRHKLLTWTVGFACHRCLSERLFFSWTILTRRLTLLVLISVRRATDTKATRNELKSSDTTYKKEGKSSLRFGKPRDPSLLLP